MVSFAGKYNNVADRDTSRLLFELDSRCLNNRDAGVDMTLFLSIVMVETLLT